MKKIKIGLILLSLFIGINFVKAEIDPGTNYIFPIENTLEQKPNEEAINYIYNTLTESYTNKDYIIKYQPFNTSQIYIIFFEIDNSYLEIWGNDVPQLEYHIFNGFTECVITNSNTHESACQNYEYDEHIISLLRTRTPGNENINWYAYYDSSFNINSLNNFEMRGFYQDNIVVEENKSLPKLKDLYNYTSFSEYEQEHIENYTEVNLDNYEYVLLSLKNYSQKEAFQTNLQVKGQIGITPIYNFGQTSKDSVTGTKVQDRCNVNYENYTNYPFYILQSDLQNNVIYAIKECNNSSSFKFDNTIFNITYITSENKDNPTITINGNTYDVIPYDDLPSNATKNEEDNYIPGESGSANDTGGLDGAITGAQRKLGEIWNSITYFTSFIGQIFSSLPSEVHTILISAFTIMIMLGIIKIFLGK